MPEGIADATPEPEREVRHHVGNPIGTGRDARPAWAFLTLSLLDDSLPWPVSLVCPQISAMPLSTLRLAGTGERSLSEMSGVTPSRLRTTRGIA